MPAYSVELGTRICELIAENKSLREICAMPGMPTLNSVTRWTIEHPEFGTAYARAREQQADAVDADMRSLEDRTIAGDIDPKAANVVLGNMRWRAERLAPKRYGAKVDHSHQGSVSLTVVTSVPDPAQ